MKNNSHNDIKPFFSIITVVYNGEKTLRKTINSVINQKYQNFEYIIIDGGSTDNTVSIIEEYGEGISKWISEGDAGIYDAMNKGLLMATGDVIGIVNADDYLELDALQNVMAVYKPGLKIYHGSLTNIDLNGRRFINRSPKSLSRLKRGMIVNHPATFVNKKVYVEIGMFSTKYRIAGDWDFILNAYLKKVEFIRIDEVLANFMLGGVSGTISKKYLKELSNVRKDRGVFKYLDFYYYYDLIRFAILGKNLYRLYLLKKKIFNA